MEDDEAGSQGEEEEDEEEDDDASRSAGRVAGDWYDVDDGFIDDSEVVYAPVDVGKAKHSGFFINKARARAPCDGCAASWAR